MTVEEIADLTGLSPKNLQKPVAQRADESPEVGAIVFSHYLNDRFSSSAAINMTQIIDRTPTVAEKIAPKRK